MWMVTIYPLTTCQIMESKLFFPFINKGVLSEIPNMINNLPEKWRLPSHISILTQIAQLVPLLYLFARWLCPAGLTHQKFIYFLLVVNAVTCYMLSYFWNKTLNINNEERSVGLYFFSFISALISKFSQGFNGWSLAEFCQHLAKIWTQTNE